MSNDASVTRWSIGWAAPVLGIALGAIIASGTGCKEAPAEATPERGKVLYDNYCAQCHKVDGVGQESVGAPSIAGLPEWYVKTQLMNFRQGIRGAHFDDIEGLRMRPMSLTLPSQHEVDAVAMYVGTMRPVPPTASVQGGDAGHGAQLFGTCQACHGADGKGNEAMGAPPLTVQPDWYLVRQLGKFKAGVRGADPRDTRGATMRPMASGLADEQAMKDVVGHVVTLR